MMSEDDITSVISGASVPSTDHGPCLWHLRVPMFALGQLVLEMCDQLFENLFQQLGDAGGFRGTNLDGELCGIG
jgi:hypothetical protein